MENLGLIAALCISGAVYYLFFLLYREMFKANQEEKIQDNDDQIMLKILKEREILTSVYISQSFTSVYFIENHFSESPDFARCVLYVYYDKIAEFHCHVIFGERNDNVKGYLRDAALQYYEQIGFEKQKQFRTFAADERSYKEIQNKPIHPIQLLNVLYHRPLFDTILRQKVDEKVRAYAHFLMEKDVNSIIAQLRGLLSDQALHEVFVSESASIE